ncbi:hemoblobin-interacting domain-containing protein [Brevibacillus reuszeri]|uniref:hemoblobin-interacting domain-containing protein n=1 Tax=Brevibacillus reuszeri TaxID=54915 RepID=UPI001BB32DAC|nr:hemoblobin-interacting domain-containing protein [Brevibacillus reuszeri]
MVFTRILLPDAPYPTFIFTFTDNPTWRANITSITIGNQTLTEVFEEGMPGDYLFGSSDVTSFPVELDEGINFIAFNPQLFPDNKEYIITFHSTGYPNVTLTVQGSITPPPQ